MHAAELRSEGEKLLVQPEIMALAEGLACVPEVRIGAAAEVIAAYAAEQGCDAIVMGTRGMGAVAGLAMGSVAQKVVHLASVPVTLVSWAAASGGCGKTKPPVALIKLLKQGVTGTGNDRVGKRCILR